MPSAPTSRRRPPRKRPYRVLIVDDNHGDILLLHEALRAADLAAEVETFTDSEDALRYVSGFPGHAAAPKPDVIVMDMHLPKLDATTILDAINENGSLSGTPVIILSSSISNGDREQMKRYRLARHMVKPSDLDEFLKIGVTVREVLEGRAQA